jgi:hypothetical protein
MRGTEFKSGPDIAMAEVSVPHALARFRAQGLPMLGASFGGPEGRRSDSYQPAAVPMADTFLSPHLPPRAVLPPRGMHSRCVREGERERKTLQLSTSRRV